MQMLLLSYCAQELEMAEKFNLTFRQMPTLCPQLIKPFLRIL